MRPLSRFDHEALEALVDIIADRVLERLGERPVAGVAADEWVTVAEAARITGQSRSTISAAIARVDLKADRPKGTRSIRIRRAELKAWMDGPP